MIIQALYERYTQLASDPNSGVSPLYFSAGKVSYVLMIDKEGNLLRIDDVRQQSGKKLAPITVTVPEQASRSSGDFPYFLCDKAEYVLGHYVVTAKETETVKKRTDAQRKHKKGADLAREVLQGVEDEAGRAVLAFYERWNPDEVREHPLVRPILADLDKGIDTNMTFRLAGDEGLICRNEAMKEAWTSYRRRQDGSGGEAGQCLVTGGRDVPIARTHDKIKGVRNAQSAGASLVSFNFPAANSYGKEQSFNAPVGKIAAFGYTTALNQLLASERNRIAMGDLTVVFWSGRPEVAEEVDPMFASFFGAYSPSDETPQTERQLKGVLGRIRDGLPVGPDRIPYGEVPFYVLGLSPNNARLSVRFFWNGSIGELAGKLAMHVEDFALRTQEGREESFPNLFRVLREMMRMGSDGKKVGDEPPERLKGELFRSAMMGTRYPYPLYTGIVGRIRADGVVNRLRASILKAYLTRDLRISQGDNGTKGDVSMGLDETNKEPAYRLGRLFAVLEKAQQDALGHNVNSTIKDRYFSSASSNPGTVFPLLIKLSQYHTGKAQFGGFRDREMMEIIEELNEFPAQLSLHEQGRFFIGYYHQKQAFFEAMKTRADAKREAAAGREEDATSGPE